jgi:hypothetical protein|tara:strand:+ start:715 stop:1212 length:498 start_codon:yes stop_codon:yes gene_type:complete
MANLSRGKYAQAISDQSGMAFPYTEMVTQWDGLFVHCSEVDPKQPQLQPKPHTADGQGLPKARPARVEPAVASLLPGNPFSFTLGSSIVTVTEPSNGRSTGDVVVFRNVDGSPGGLVFSLFENAAGFSITVVNINSYSFDCGSNATLTENSGGMLVTAGPVTLTP